MPENVLENIIKKKIEKIDNLKKSINLKKFMKTEKAKKLLSNLLIHKYLYENNRNSNRWI